jgi:hypothetical protein
MHAPEFWWESSFGVRAVLFLTSSDPFTLEVVGEESQLLDEVREQLKALNLELCHGWNELLWGEECEQLVLS